MPRSYGWKELPAGQLAKRKRLEDYQRRFAAVQPWQPGPTLDQDDTPECVAGAGTHWLNSTPIPHTFDWAYADGIYKACKVIDGDNENGTTDLSLYQVLKARGFLKDAAWTQSVSAAAQYVDTVSPVVVGSIWYYSMEEPDPDTGIVKVDRWTGVAGGHEICWIADLVVDATEYAVIQNSWGKWGIPFRGIPYGFALVALSDLQGLMRDLMEGDVMTGVELPVTPPTPTPPPQPSGCLAGLGQKLARR